MATERMQESEQLSLTSEQYCRVSLRVLGGQHTGGLLLVAQCIGDEVHDQKME